MNDDLTDESPCPIEGRYKDLPMLEVPSHYLDWLHGQPWLSRKYPSVLRYIERSRKAIDQDLKRKDRER